MKQNDTDPPYRVSLIEVVNGVVSPIDLTGSTVTFVMVDRTGTVKVNAAADIEDAANGVVSYQWQAGDTDTVGDYRILLHIALPSGKTRTFPDLGYDSLKIELNYP